MNKAVCKIVGFDEFGPLFEWSKHWGELPVGTVLAVHEAALAATPVAPHPDTKDAERWRAFLAAGGDLTLRLHNTRSDMRNATIDAAMAGKGKESSE